MLPDDISDAQYEKLLNSVPALVDLVKDYMSDLEAKDVPFVMEFILWGLASFSKLSRDRYEEGHSFNDLFNSYLRDTLQSGMD